LHNQFRTSLCQAHGWPDTTLSTCHSTNNGDKRVDTRFQRDVRSLSALLHVLSWVRCNCGAYSYLRIVTWSDTEGHLRIPNKLVKDQFFEKLRALTKAYYADLESFVFNGDIDSLQRALREFTNSLHLSPIDDDRTEPSLKVRVLALLSNFPKIGDDYEIESEHKIYEGKAFKKNNIYMRSKGDLTSRIIELKSVPIHWLEPSHWKKGSKRFTLKTKQEAVEKIARMTPQELLCLPLNLVIQGGWDQKFATVGEYIEAGREQTTSDLDIFERNEGQRPLGYLIWAVGVRTIHVEHITNSE